VIEHHLVAGLALRAAASLIHTSLHFCSIQRRSWAGQAVDELYSRTQSWAEIQLSRPWARGFEIHHFTLQAGVLQPEGVCEDLVGPFQADLADDQVGAQVCPIRDIISSSTSS
jgi:hypothetical protein